MLNELRQFPGRLLLLACLAVFSAGAATPPAKGSFGIPKNGPRAKPAPGAKLFTNGVVLHFKIEVSAPELNALRREPRKYARATITEGGKVYKDVAIHVKGAAGSTRSVDDKPALTLSFGKFTPDQKFHGLRKIHLNNSVQDGSYLSEILCGELFRAAGVPATRGTHALVELNGRKLGLFVMKEGFSKDFLGIYFKNPDGNLYDGGFLREITDPLNLESGDENSNWADLKALAAAAQEPDNSKRWDRLQKTLDVDRFANYLVLEAMLWDWDGYMMNRNNYRVFHDLETDRMVFFPHGMDQMFWEVNGPMIPNMNGLVANAFMRTAEGRRLYRQRFSEIYTNVFQVKVLTNRVAQLAKTVTGALATLDPNAARDYQGQANRIRDLIVARAASLEKQLNTPAPQPLKFQSGVAKVTGWRIENESATAKLEQAKDPDGRAVLRITTAMISATSWRAAVQLEAGHYRFEGLARTAGVVPVITPTKGAGAGLRISGSLAERTNKMSGDTPWKMLAYEFDVPPPGDEIVLVCELRASKGDVWFDADSLRLVKTR
jgi:spore coat protein CotH